MHLPLLVRENTLLPISGNEQRRSGASRMSLRFTPFASPTAARQTLKSSPATANAPLSFAARREGATLTFEGDGRARNLRVLLRSRRAAGEIVNGRALAATPEGLLIQWRDTARPMHLEMAPDEETA